MPLTQASQVKVKRYPLIGAVWANFARRNEQARERAARGAGYRIIRDSHEAPDGIGYCEECEHDWESARKGAGVGRDGLTCWQRVCNAPTCATVVRRGEGCPVHKSKIGDYNVYKFTRPQLRDLHMQRCGIPWSVSYAPDYRPFERDPQKRSKWHGKCFQDFICTFGRRYVSPNYWTTGGGTPATWIRDRSKKVYVGEDQRDKWYGTDEKGHYTYVRIPGPACMYGGGRRYLFADMEEATKFVRQQAYLWSRGKNVDPYQFEAAFFQWARLGKVPVYKPADNLIQVLSR